MNAGYSLLKILRKFVFESKHIVQMRRLGKWGNRAARQSKALKVFLGGYS